MCTQPKGHMGKSKALETALNNKLLGSHEHLKKGIFSPTPLYDPNMTLSSFSLLAFRKVFVYRFSKVFKIMM